MRCLHCPSVVLRYESSPLDGVLHWSILHLSYCRRRCFPNASEDSTPLKTMETHSRRFGYDSITQFVANNSSQGSAKMRAMLRGFFPSDNYLTLFDSTLSNPQHGTGIATSVDRMCRIHAILSMPTSRCSMKCGLPVTMMIYLS